MNHSQQPHGQEWSLLFQLTSEGQSMRETTANGEQCISTPEQHVPEPAPLTTPMAHHKWSSSLPSFARCRALKGKKKATQNIQVAFSI